MTLDRTTLDEISERGKWVLAWILGLLILTGIGIWSFSPPFHIPSDSPFTPQQLQKELDLFQKPHPIGSEEHEQIFRQLLNLFEKEGFSSSFQEGFSCASPGVKWFHTLLCGTVKNIILHLPGQVDAPKILLMAHYDSTPTGPGLGDDAQATVVLIQIARILKSESLYYPVDILLTDGEEAGLLGAALYLRSIRSPQSIQAVLNIEGRGNRGPSIMFETAKNSGHLLKLFSQTSPKPIAFSPTEFIYQRMPNDTDFTLFKERDIPGLNFAHILGFWAYHTLLDSPKNVSPNLLYHQGEQILRLVRKIQEDRALEHPAQKPDIFFTFPFLKLIQYSSQKALILTVLGTVWMSILLLLGIGLDAKAFRRFITFFPFFIEILFLSGLIGWGIATLVREIYVKKYDLIWGYPGQIELLLPATCGLVLGILISYIMIRARHQPVHLMDGALVGFWWSILSILIIWKAPEASYLFHIPLLGLCGGITFLYLFPKTHTGLWALIFISWIPAFMVFFPFFLFAYPSLRVTGLILTAVLVGFILLAGFIPIHFFGSRKAWIKLALVMILLSVGLFGIIFSRTPDYEFQHELFIEDFVKGERYYATANRHGHALDSKPYLYERKLFQFARLLPPVRTTKPEKLNSPYPFRILTYTRTTQETFVYGLRYERNDSFPYLVLEVHGTQPIQTLRINGYPGASPFFRKLAKQTRFVMVISDVPSPLTMEWTTNTEAYFDIHLYSVSRVRKNSGASVQRNTHTIPAPGWLTNKVVLKNRIRIGRHYRSSGAPQWRGK